MPASAKRAMMRRASSGLSITAVSVISKHRSAPEAATSARANSAKLSSDSRRPEMLTETVRA